MFLTLLIGIGCLTFGRLPNALGHTQNNLNQNYLISPDQPIARNLLNYLNSSDNKFPDLQLSGYDYATSEGYIIDDSSFLPSYEKAQATPRQVIYESNGLVVQRAVTAQEIAEIHQASKKATHDGYQDNIQNEIIQTVQIVENRLPIENSSFGVVRDIRTGKIIGTLRVYKGFTESGKIILPSFEILRYRNLLTTDDENAIFKLAGQSYGQETAKPIIEVGQFYIDEKRTPAERAEIKRQLWAWFTATTLDFSFNEKIIVAHVSKNILARKYKQEYGFDQTIIEKTFTEQDKEITEKVTIANSTVMKNKLLKMIHPASHFICRSLFD